MMLDFIFFVKRVKNIITTTNINKNTSLETLNKLYEDFHNTFNSDFIIIDEKGKSVFGKSFTENITENSYTKLFTSNDSLFNINFNDYFHSSLPYKEVCIIPLNFNNKKAISIVYRNKKQYSNEEIIVLEMFFTILEIFLKSYYSNKKNEFEHNINVVKKTIMSLSYSELEAMYYVFNSFEGDEVVLVASALATEKSISRSVIVSGLKKLAIAKAINYSSMGNKGTYIKILYTNLRSDLK